MSDYSRQGEWFEPSKFDLPVHVIGCGATGSFVALQLVKMGIREIHLYDFDIVEEHNLANQVYGKESIGLHKVIALDVLLGHHTSLEQNIHIHNEKVDGNTQLDGVVFVLTDTMSSRKEIWEGALKYKPSVKLVVETRMSVNAGRVYVVNPMLPYHVNPYEKTFYDDTEAEVSFCGSSLSIVPTAINIASYAVWNIIKLYLEKPMDNELLLDLEYNNMISTKWNL